MTDYPYPADEFDEAPAGGQSAGIHRAPRSRWSRIWPFLAVLLIFAALAAGLYVWFTSHSPSKPTQPSVTTTAAQDPTPTETTPTETGPEETTPEETTPEESDEPTTDDATDDTTDDADETDEPATQEPDRSVTVRVLNATRIQGLAAGAVNDVKALGYTDVSGDNYRGNPVSSSQVWYKSPEHAAAAREIAEKLGISAVSEVSSLVGPVSVILSSDFAS
ncbi:LytR cell envelope-related transcriptional attenuator [Flavimobilis soli]|uniref:LytR cell envelope-related transcriptional attenuator n=1 Tax=Flavimobilis soli TaxID=442709 RepID=A0A2A9EEY7_9MICO|nr:LytR C-terminal domain-containing protein [Flavimobilis soli]PFG37363.1 LytR cell envelope-related transcriptional attenuator [Flavimobilis soli]